MSQGTEQRGEIVQSVAKTLAVIQSFDAEHRDLTLSDVARRTSLSRATARRFLLSLQALGYVRASGSHFSLTPRVLRLGHAFLSSLALPDIAEPHLKELSVQLGESTSASVWDGDDIVYVARVQTRRIMTVGIRVGTRFPAYATSMGRAMLAFAPPEAVGAYLARVELRPLTPRTTTSVGALQEELRRIRERGWALVDQELEVGLRSVAAPVRVRSGEVVAAINASMPVGFADADHQPSQDLVDAVVATARRIGEDLALAQPDLRPDPERWGRSV